MLTKDVVLLRRRGDVRYNPRGSSQKTSCSWGGGCYKRSMWIENHDVIWAQFLTQKTCNIIKMFIIKINPHVPCKCLHKLFVSEKIDLLERPLKCRKPQMTTKSHIEIVLFWNIMAALNVSETMRSLSFAGGKRMWTKEWERERKKVETQAIM